MRIHLGANYQGYKLARELETALNEKGHEVIWQAAAEFDDNDDYPVYCIRVGQAVVEDEDTGITARGVMIGGTGAAEAIATNKVNGARAVHTNNPDVVVDARAHADANILVLGADLVDLAQATALTEILVDQPFLTLLDDARRVVNTAEFENSGTIEGWMIEYSSGSSGPTPREK